MKFLLVEYLNHRTPSHFRNIWTYKSPILRHSMYNRWSYNPIDSLEFITNYTLLKENKTMPTVNCLMCSQSITDEDFQYPLYQEEYPEILIGPYCESCMAKIKICSGCQHPFDAALTTYVGNGEHYCPSCASSLVLCGSCNIKVAESALINHEGIKYCPSCFNREFFKCPVCDEYHLKEGSVEKSSLQGITYAGIFRKYGERVCNTCYEKKKPHFKRYEVAECRHCGTVYRKTTSSHDTYCDRCYASFPICSDCGTKHPLLKKYIVEGNRKTICERCLLKYNICDSCGDLYTGEAHLIKGSRKVYVACARCKDKVECKICLKLVEPSRDNKDVCNTCNNLYLNNKCNNCGRLLDRGGYCRVCTSTQVYNYSEKPPLFFNRTERSIQDTIFFGFENEMTFSGSSSQSKALKHLYSTYGPDVLLAKSDSSIAGAGYEVVSQPMTLGFFKSMDLDGIFAKDPVKHPSCGLHVHVDRQSFLSELHLYKVINFIHTNEAHTHKVAGRGNNGYCEKFDKKITGILKDNKRGRGDRHVAVNLTNKYTVEFRMFAGCTTSQELRYKIEWLHALIEYTKVTGVSKVNDIDNFLDYLKQHIKSYQNIFEFLRV